MLNTHILMKGFDILSLKNIYDIYKYKTHSFLSIHTSEVRKYRPDMDMSNKNFSLSRFLSQCWIVCFIVRFDYFIITNAWAYVMCDIQLERKFNYLLLWYIANADWLIRTSTTDVCVTIPSHFKQVRGYSHINGQKTPMGLTFGLLASTYVY